MYIDMSQNRARAAILTVVACLSLVACTATTPVTDEFDEGTGVTISYSQPPIILSRETPGYGAYARNVVQVGAIEVNRSGTRQYFLWLGIWNTVQSATAADHRDWFDSIVVFADGEPLLFDIRGWTADTIGTSNPVYNKPVASSVDAYFPVSLDQIRLIANAQDIRLEAVGSSLKRFEVWDDQRLARQNLSAFVEQVSRTRHD